MSPELTALILLAIGLAMLMANLLKVPQSTTQATVFALAGAAVYLDVLQTRRLFLEIIPLWFILPVCSFVLTFLIGRFVHVPVRQRWPSLGANGRMPFFGWLVIGVSCYVAFAIGSNNVANAAGPILSMTANELGLAPGTPQFGLLLILATLVVAPCFAIGSSVFGGDLVEKVGRDLLELGPFAAVTISVVTATLLLAASLTRGVPTSLVQMNIAAIMGMGLAKHGWGILRGDTPLWRMCRVWFAAPLIAFALSFAATAAVVKSGLVG
jgi:phosphate/sulfate permease